MADKSSIEWTDATWTPIRARNLLNGAVGWHCEHVSEGCRNCYAERINQRLGTGLAFKPGHLGGKFGPDIELFLDEKMLLAPLRWKKPRRVFVCSMTDLFADFIPDTWIDRMFAVMALAPQHTFQVLTKRSARMRKYFSGIPEEPAEPAFRDALIEGWAQELWCRRNPKEPDPSEWLAVHMPLPNVWLGVSAERQQEADERVPDLLATPAAVRFVSAEPLLGEIDFTALTFPGASGRDVRFDALGPQVINYAAHIDPQDPGVKAAVARVLNTRLPFLDWLIVGGESGPHARPMHPDWARKIRDDCGAAGVPFFFKQWGEFAPAFDKDLRPLRGMPWKGSDQRAVRDGLATPDQAAKRVGKSRAGRMLDGVAHDASPPLAGKG
jgi:protein gp37